jgi:hypothetical protein
MRTLLMALGFFLGFIVVFGALQLAQGDPLENAVTKGVILAAIVTVCVFGFRALTNRTDVS